MSKNSLLRCELKDNRVGAHSDDVHEGSPTLLFFVYICCLTSGHMDFLISATRILGSFCRLWLNVRTQLTLHIFKLRGGVKFFRLFDSSEIAHELVHTLNIFFMRVTVIDNSTA
jgi:hypothetical protein